MDTQTPDKLSHDEAFELLPWHVNATLDATLSEQVAEHVDRCATCQEESALLSNTIFALNTGDTVATSLDTRFGSVLGRVRDYEHGRQAAREQHNEPLRKRVARHMAEWLGFSQSRLQWAGAFALGMAVGIGALLFTLQPGQVDPGPIPVYETHASGQMPLRLRVEFEEPPRTSALDELGRSIGQTADWHRQSDTLYLLELSDEMTIKAVADVRSRLLADESVTAVAVDIGTTETD